MESKWMLLRGLSRGNGHWGDFPSILETAGAQVELMEIPGNGTCYKEETPLNILKVIENIKGRSRFCQSKESFNICGISLGGMVALKWAEVFPKEIQSVAVINTSLKQFSPFYHRLIPQNYSKIISAIMKKNMTEREQIILEITSNRLEKASKYLNSFVEFTRKNPISHWNFGRQLLLANAITISEEIKVPLKIISSQGDRLVHPTCSLEISRKLRLKPFIHPTAGHDLPLDEPQWLSEVLLG